MLKVVWCFNDAAYVHWQCKHFRAVARASSFVVSGVRHIAMTGTVLHNAKVSNDLLGHSGCWYEMSLCKQCGLSFPDRLLNGGSHLRKQAGYETSSLPPLPLP